MSIDYSLEYYIQRTFPIYLKHLLAKEYLINLAEELHISTLEAAILLGFRDYYHKVD